MRIRNRRDGWPDFAIKRVARISYGLGQPPRLTNTGIPIIRATNIERGKINGQSLIYTELNDLPLNRAPLLREGEILVVRSGAYTGDSARITREWVGSAPGYDLRTFPWDVDSRFLAYSLLGKSVADQIDIVKNRAAQPHLNAEEFGEIRIFVPEKKSQTTIVDYLDTETARIDALITKKHKLSALLDDRFRSYADWATQQGTAIAMRRVTSVITSGPRGWSEYAGDSGRPFIRSANLHRDSLRLREDNLLRVEVPSSAAEALRSQVQVGDTVVGITGANTGWTGLVGEPHSKGYVSQHVALLRPRGIIPEWLAYSVFSRRVQEQLMAGQYGGTKLQLGLDDLASLTIFAPSVEDQKRVCRELEQAAQHRRKLSDRLLRQIELLREHRQALITATVTGELDVARRGG